MTHKRYQTTGNKQRTLDHKYNKHSYAFIFSPNIEDWIYGTSTNKSRQRGGKRDRVSF